MSLLFAYIAVLCVYCAVPVHAQRWQPAAQLDGASLNINVITLPDGTTLIPLRRMRPNQGDSNVLYSVQSLLTDRTPWPKQFNGLPKIKGVCDGNGNGHPEVRFDPHSGLPQMAFDAFSPIERTEQIASDSGSWPIPGQMVEYRGDIDGDRLEDQWVLVRGNQYSIVVYGDTPNPYMQRSIVPVSHERADELRTQILAVGPLSGKMCMVQLAFKADDNNIGFYQLLELNTEDLRARRDTIRTTLLNEVANTSGYAFDDKVLKADTVWHLFTTKQLTEVPSLKVTLKTSTIQPTRSVIREGGNWLWYGQGNEGLPWNFPVTFSADRLIAAETSLGSGLWQRVLRLYTCSNSDSAVLTPFADAQLPIEADTNRDQAVIRCTLIPDQDGDGIEDVVVEHFGIEYGTTTEKNAVSIFLTTHIVPVSVDDQVLQTEKVDASTVLTARRLDNAWIVPLAGRCAQRDLSPVYNVQGQKIATVRTEVIGDDVILHDNGAITSSPTWCVMGNCIVRLP